jgi:hypothetical protein
MPPLPWALVGALYEGIKSWANSLVEGRNDTRVLGRAVRMTVLATSVLLAGCGLGAQQARVVDPMGAGGLTPRI